MLIHNISQLLTLTEKPQRGDELGTLNIINDGAVLIKGKSIEAVGNSSTLLSKYPKEPRLNARGRVVMPGFVDPHTHLVFAGDRAAEFEMRLEGKSYMEIMAAGGGIMSTVRDTRAAGREGLLAQTRERARSMFKFGVTTAEAKSGYGLELKSELEQLGVLLELNDRGPLEIAPTFLGAHAIPEEYKDDPDGYTALLCTDMLPKVRDWWHKHAGERPLPFVDVFCEDGAFNLEQTRCILNAAKTLGFPLKIHADEFASIGGTPLAVSLGAVSADHLLHISTKDIEALAKSDTIAVALPGTPFGLADPKYMPARDIIAANGLLAIASDLNPGTAWCENIQLVIALACRYLKLAPAEAIAAVTINAAAAIRREDRIGSIHPGKQADLLILSTSDYRHLGYRFGANVVDTVIKKGKVY